MGKFEDLLTRAREGDAEALDELESEFGGSNLREQAEAATKALKENDPFIRTGKFQTLMAELGDADVTLDDLEGVDTNDFSADLLRAKADEKAERKAAAKLMAAQDAGFDSVEEYDQALEALKSAQDQRKSGMEALGGATASTSGGQTPPAEEKDPYEEALETYKEARKGGMTQDYALGETAHTIMARQHPVPLEEK
jgi:hypothetical protein